MTMIPQSPLLDRYARKEMAAIFSPQNKYGHWRKLWLSLAKHQKQLGIAIPDRAITEMEEAVDDIDFYRVRDLESETKHEVPAHIAALSEKAPSAKGFIHLGATSAFVMDNTDLILMRSATHLLLEKIKQLLAVQEKLAIRHSALPCVGFTHLQPASPTTYGKRIALWMQDILDDYTSLKAVHDDFPFLGMRGATGTQIAILTLFQGEEKKVEKLEKCLRKDFGFHRSFSLSSQTYPRKFDAKIVGLLSSFATSCHKMANDLRLLAHMNEVHEGLGKKQVGSSAMPHKRNPIHLERVCSLARMLQAQESIFVQNASHQWLERTLDDSANRRIGLPECFLLADSLATLLTDIFSNLDFNQDTIEKNMEEKWPEIVAENIVAIAATYGADRDLVHEKLRVMLQGKNIAREDLIHNILQNADIPVLPKDVKTLLSPRKLTGLAEKQVKTFLKEQYSPLVK